MGQLSFFSAEARQPCVGDLAGLLCGPGQALGFARGRAARVSVGVDTRARGAALVQALAERGVLARIEPARIEPARPKPVEREPETEPSTEPGPGSGPGPEGEPETASGLAGNGAAVPESWQVTTAFRTDLTGLAAQWLDGCRKIVPAGFALDGGALRLWALASGRWVESGYFLGLDPEAPDTHETLRKALATSGLPATLLTGKAGGPALRVVGRRRLERLAELVGRAPRGVAERTWPAA